MADTIIDLDSITADPSKRPEQFYESNVALTNFAKNASARFSAANNQSQKLRELESGKLIQDEVLNQKAAIDIEKILVTRDDAVEDLDATMEVVNETFEQQLNDLFGLQQEMNNKEDYNWFERRKFRSEARKLDQEALVTKNILDEMRQQKAQINEATAQTIEQYNARFSIRKQAMDNEDYMRQTLELQNNLKTINEKMQADATILDAVLKRQSLSPGELEQNERNGLEIFEFMHFITHNGEPSAMQKYGTVESRQMQAIYSAMSPEEQRALQYGNAMYLRSKYAGVPMTIGQYKQFAGQQGEVGTLEVIAKLSGDTDTVAVLEEGKNTIRGQIYEQLIAKEEEAQFGKPLTEADRMAGMQLSTGTMNKLSKQTDQLLTQMDSNTLFDAAVVKLEDDVSTYSINTGQDMYIRAAEDPASLMSTTLFSPKVQEYFASEEAKKIMTTPQVGNNTPWIDTSMKLVESMRSKGFSESEANTTVAEFNKQASIANYKTRRDFGSQSLIKNMRALEKVGYQVEGSLKIPIPEKLRNAATTPEQRNRMFWDMTNPTDLAVALAHVKKFRIQAQERQKLEEQAARGTARTIELPGVFP